MVLRVRLLGGFEVEVDGALVDEKTWPSRRAQDLVALLALASGRRLPVEQAIDALWPALDAEAGRSNLHKAASYARRALGDRAALVVRGGTVALWPDAQVIVDVQEFESAGEVALRDGDADVCGRLADRYGGDLLPESPYEEWTIARRDRLRALQVNLLRRAGRWADVLDVDELDEDAHRSLMEEQLRNGRLHAAIRQFHRLRSVLARELNVVPSAESYALYRSILGSSAGHVRPALVGREVELVRARGLVRRATEGRPAAIMVTGPAGIGKTRLCEELVDQLGADGWTVVRAHASEHSRSVPYAPLLEALDMGGAPRSGTVDGLDEADRDLVRRLLRSDVTVDDEPVHRHTVLRLLSRALASFDRPAALFVDDLHLADDDTVALVSVLASAPPPRGSLLLTTYRSDVAPLTVVEMTRGLVAAGTGIEITLGPLTRFETDLIVEAAAGRAPTPSEAAAAWDLSDGNPFFALEVASALSSDARAVAGDLSGVLEVRLARAAPAVRGALGAVALVTDEFDADALSALAGIDPDTALTVIEDGIEAGIVAARDDGLYRFRHALVRGALTRQASQSDRSRVHAVFAEWLEHEGAPPARIAHHLIAAGRDAEAVPLLRLAAGQAMSIGAHRDAAQFADSGLAIVPGTADLLGLRADALFGAGDPGAAAAYAVAMTAATGTERGRLAVSRARALVLGGEIEAALETLDAVDLVAPADEVQQLVTRGLAVWCLGGLDDAAALGVEAKRRAEKSGSIRDFVDATMLLAMVAHERGAWPRQVALDLLDLQLRPDLAVLAVDAHLCVAESYLYGGVPYEEIIEFANDLRARATATGTAHAEAFAITLLGEAHLLTGALAPATELLSVAAAAYKRIGVSCGQALSLQRLAEAVLAGGDRVGAQRLLADALAAARGSPMATRHLLDRIHGTAIRAATDPAAALEAVLEATHGVKGPLESCPPCSVNRTIPSAVACADAGDLEGARAFLGVAEHVVGAFYRQGGWNAALDEARSHLARAEGDVALADRLLADAGDRFEREGQVLDARRCRAVLEAGKV